MLSSLIFYLTIQLCAVFNHLFRRCPNKYNRLSSTATDSTSPIAVVGTHNNASLVSRIIRHHGALTVDDEREFVSSILPKAVESMGKVLGSNQNNDAFFEALEHVVWRPHGNDDPCATQLVVGICRWSRIQRGRDLFIKGIGQFDINKCYEQACIFRQEKNGRCWLLAPLEAFYPFFLRRQCKKLHPKEKVPGGIEDMRMKLRQSGMLDIQQMTRNALKQGGIKKAYFMYAMEAIFVPVEVVQLHGYFPELVSASTEDHSNHQNHRLLDHYTYLLSRENDCPQRKHLLSPRGYHFWSKPENMGHIDEIADAARRWEAKDDDYFWPENDVNMTPVEILKAFEEERKKRERGPLVTFDYLKDLKDGMNIKVLRTNYEIVDAANKLHNCAAEYIPQVAREESFLVVLLDEAGQPVAMGEYHLVDVLLGFGRTLGARNRLLSREDLTAFEEYDKRTVRPWLSQVFGCIQG